MHDCFGCPIHHEWSQPLTDSISTYPFAIFGNRWEHAMENKTYPHKGNSVIENDVWIGYKATIMAGVTIGDGAIIAANSTVIKDVAPYSIVGGNPAVEIRKRFSDEIIEELLQIRWWDWESDKITKFLHLLTGNRIEELSKIE